MSADPVLKEGRERVGRGLPAGCDVVGVVSLRFDRMPDGRVAGLDRGVHVGARLERAAMSKMGETLWGTATTSATEGAPDGPSVRGA